MQSANAPGQLTTPFANEGNKNTIPVPSQITVTPGAASWEDGFPPATMEPITAGGVPPSGLDFNGVLFAISAVAQYLNAGGGFMYNSAFSTAIGGYPKGARLLQAAGIGYWINTVDNNTTDPDTGGAGWFPQGAGTTSSVYASTQQTLAVGSAKILFDTVEFDSGFWNATNQRFQALYAGKYRISGAVQLPAPGNQNLSTQIWKNGEGVKHCFQAPQVSDVDLALPFEAILNLAVGDFIEVYLLVSQTPVLAGIVGSNQPFVFAQVEYLGT